MMSPVLLSANSLSPQLTYCNLQLRTISNEEDHSEFIIQAVVYVENNQIIIKYITTDGLYDKLGDLCLSSRALRTLGLSSALIWSEMIIVSTTRWAIPGREFCSRSSRMAPAGQQQRKGRTSVTLGQRTTSQQFYFVTFHFLPFEICAFL